MFTGLVEALGTVVELAPSGANQRITLQAPFTQQLVLGQSVAHNGVCLTVVDLQPETGHYSVEAVPETLARTNLGHWQPGHLINLERAMRADARLDGHLVQGHVDAVGELVELTETDQAWRLRVRYPAQHAALVIEKGSIALDGISLTVVHPGPDVVEVAIIPHTYAHTNLHTRQPGHPINLEFDLVGKYILRQQQLAHATNPTV